MDTLTIINKLEIFFSTYGYPTVLVGSLIEITPMGWIVPGGIILAVAGFFANNQSGLSIIGIIISGWLGAWITFIVAYVLGRKTGFWLVKKLKQEKNADLAKHLLTKHGGVILTTSMMANLTRFWMAYVAGIEKYNFFKFLFYSSLASLGWVSLMTILGYLAGFERENLESVVAKIGIFSWVFLGIAIFVIYKSIVKEYKVFKDGLEHETT